MLTLTVAQKNWIDQDNAQSSQNGNPMSAIVAGLLASANTGTISITADGRDVNQVASANGVPRWDNDTYPGTNLNFGWKPGRMSIGPTVVTIAAGTVALAASQTNYVEVDKTGTVSTNTASFTAGRCPLFIVTSGSATFLSTGVVSAQAYLTLLGLGSVTGSMLTVPGQTKEIGAYLGAVANTGAYSFTIKAPNTAAAISAIKLVSTTGVAASDTSYWTVTAVNLGPSGSGSTALLAASPANTTKVTGGTAIVAGVAWSAALTGTTANLNTAANDVIEITLTPTSTPTALTLARVDIDFAFTA